MFLVNASLLIVRRVYTNNFLIDTCRKCLPNRYIWHAKLSSIRYNQQQGRMSHAQYDSLIRLPDWTLFLMHHRVIPTRRVLCATRKAPSLSHIIIMIINLRTFGVMLLARRRYSHSRLHYQQEKCSVAICADTDRESRHD